MKRFGHGQSASDIARARRRCRRLRRTAIADRRRDPARRVQGLARARSFRGDGACARQWAPRRRRCLVARRRHLDRRDQVVPDRLSDRRQMDGISAPLRPALFRRGAGLPRRGDTRRGGADARRPLWRASRARAGGGAPQRRPPQGDDVVLRPRRSAQAAASSRSRPAASTRDRSPLSHRERG